MIRHAGDTGEAAAHPATPRETDILRSHRRYGAAQSSGTGSAAAPQAAAIPASAGAARRPEGNLNRALKTEHPTSGHSSGTHWAWPCGRELLVTTESAQEEAERVHGRRKKQLQPGRR